MIQRSLSVTGVRIEDVVVVTDRQDRGYDDLTTDYGEE